MALAAGGPRELYQIHPLTDGGTLAVAGLGNLLPLIFADDIIHARCPCDPNEVNSFDRPVIGNENPLAGAVSDYSVAAAVALPLALDWADIGPGKALAEDAAVFTEVILVNGALVTLAKVAYQRPLPRVYSGQDPSLQTQPGGYRSFYSGHTSTTFAALAAASMTENLRHGFSLWPWLITVAAGTSVGAERVADGRHFYSDVLVGGLAGTAVGVLVPWLHTLECNFELASLTDGTGLTLVRRF